MLFTWISVAAALVPLAAASVLHAAPEARVTVNPQTCVGYEKYIGIHDNTLSYSPACASITEACLKENGTSIWSHQSCVAAATFQGTLSVITLNQCQNPNVLVAGSIPNLSAAVNLWQHCRLLNFVDFIYGAMSSAGVTQWPSSVDDVLTEWWKPILAWTATGDSIPYSNFNDWLHWSNS
ncbi:hypothetical protein B0H14DRAFT_2790234 [Mycena olivaceomarginata]|nr:hypothetical protein B0H14DRAFT_2790234 [Mycena olivaceomarginata]